LLASLATLVHTVPQRSVVGIEHEMPQPPALEHVALPVPAVGPAHVVQAAPPLPQADEVSVVMQSPFDAQHPLEHVSGVHEGPASELASAPSAPPSDADPSSVVESEAPTSRDDWSAAIPELSAAASATAPPSTAASAPLSTLASTGASAAASATI
jgi:hypothetical protein